MNNLIRKKYGKNINLIYGNQATSGLVVCYRVHKALHAMHALWHDWRVTKQMRNFISTPNIRVKRKMHEKFNVYNIDEYRTSCLHHKTEKKGDHLYYIDKINKERKLHSVLTFPPYFDILLRVTLIIYALICFAYMIFISNFRTFLS